MKTKFAMVISSVMLVGCASVPPPAAPRSNAAICSPQWRQETVLAAYPESPLMRGFQMGSAAAVAGCIGGALVSSSVGLDPLDACAYAAGSIGLTYGVVTGMGREEAWHAYGATLDMYCELPGVKGPLPPPPRS